MRRLCVGSESELRRPKFVAVTTYRCRVRFRRPNTENRNSSWVADEADIKNHCLSFSYFLIKLLMMLIAPDPYPPPKRAKWLRWWYLQYTCGHQWTRVFLKCRMPRYRAQATTGAPVDPIPDVYYRRAIVNDRERVLLTIAYCLLLSPLILKLESSAKLLYQLIL